MSALFRQSRQRGNNRSLIVPGQSRYFDPYSIFADRESKQQSRHAFKLSDEELSEHWSENVVWVRRPFLADAHEHLSLDPSTMI